MVSLILTMTDAEFYFLERHESTPTFGYFWESLEALMNPVPMLTAAKTNTVLDGKVSVTDSTGNGTLSGNTVTVKATGSLFSKATNTITITNETADTATLSFDYKAVTYNAFTIGGASGAASGTHTVLLAAGASVELKLTSNSGLSNRTATLTLSNFSLTVAATSSKVTVLYDDTLGSVTAGGSAVVSGATQDVNLTDGLALVATPNSGTTFLGWIDADTHEILGAGASNFTLNPAKDMTVQAVFVSADTTTPWFSLGSTTQKTESVGLLGLSRLYYYTVATRTHLFNDLNDAASTAASGTSKAMVLMNNATLPAGNYTIPAGVTLLVPFDDANTMYTTEAQSIGTYTEPTAYRTLTLASGANLTVNGAVSLSAKHYYAQGSKQNGGSPTEAISILKMEDNSNITVNNGGALYAYGFVTGSGTVTAKSGATVYEMFQIMDFRGGTQSTDMEKGVFPLSQYYVQNIEVPMTLEYGAIEYAYTTIFMSSSKFGSA
ncbi:MAG: hypothetical protein IKM39_01550, partial [Clostridia bacterium]|nr:hypothetical protein [Clostridia bacterium]